MQFWVSLCCAVVLGGSASAQRDQYDISAAITFYEQGWYFNLDANELHELAVTAAEENNRVASVSGYHVTGVGTRFVAHVVDQPPPRRLGLVDNPNWYAWRVDVDLNRRTLENAMAEYHYRRNFATLVDAYYTPQGVWYAAVFYRANSNREAFGYRQSEIIGYPQPQWGRTIQSAIRSGDHPYDTTTVVSPSGQVEYTAMLNPGRNFNTRIRQNPQWMMTASQIENWHARIRRDGMNLHDFDMTPGINGGPVHYSGLGYDGSGHDWHSAWSDGSGTGQTLVLEIPGRELRDRLDQISESGRQIRVANAVERYHRGGPENDVIYALFITGDGPLPDLPVVTSRWNDDGSPEITVADPAANRPPPPPPASILEPVNFPDSKLPTVDPTPVAAGSVGASEAVVVGNSHGLDEIRGHVRDEIHALRIHIIEKRFGRLDYTTELEGRRPGLHEEEYWTHLDSQALMSNPALFKQIIEARLRAQGIEPSGNFRIRTHGMIRRGGIIAGTNIGGGLVN